MAGVSVLTMFRHSSSDALLKVFNDMRKEHPQILKRHNKNATFCQLYPSHEKFIKESFPLALDAIKQTREIVLDCLSRKVPVLLNFNPSGDSIGLTKQIVKEDMIQDLLGEEVYAKLDQSQRDNYHFSTRDMLNLNTRFEAAWNDKGEYFAVQTIPFDQSAICLRIIDLLVLKRKINHPNLMKIFHFWVDSFELRNAIEEYTFSIVTELPDNLYGPECSPRFLYHPLSLEVVLQYAKIISAAETIAIITPLLEAQRIVHEYHTSCCNLNLTTVFFFGGEPKLNPFAVSECDFDFWPREYVNQPVSLEMCRKFDLFSVGMVAYCCFTGLPPKSFPEVPFKLLKTPEGRHLNAVILKACSPYAEKRFADADEFLRELNRHV